MVEMSHTEPQLDPAQGLLNDLRRRMSVMPQPSKITPEQAIKAVMCSFSQHVSLGEAKHVFDAIPRPLHALLGRCSVHRTEKAVRFGRDLLVTRVATHLEVPPQHAERITAAVLETIGTHLSPKEVQAIAGQLPYELRDLWIPPRGLPAVETHPIYSDIEHSVALPSTVTGAMAMADVMCTLTRRLGRGWARRLVDGLPRGVRPLLEGCVANRTDAPESFELDEFLTRVAGELHTDNPEPVVRAVFVAVQKHLPPELLQQVRQQLPAGIGAVWIAPNAG